VQRIINQIPPHRVYVEGFLGSGAVMRAKRPAEVNVGVELDERAWRAAVGHVVPGVEVHDHGPGCIVASVGAMSYEFHRADAIDYLQARRYGPECFVYLDPPYLRSTRRRQRRIYRCELSDVDHRRLLRYCKAAGCMVMLSGYDSAVYWEELAGWRVVEYEQPLRRGETSRELLWMNYPVPVELHDSRYVGDGYRERERVRRKQDRWRRRLAAMSSAERQAMMDVLLELSQAKTAGD
jgi:hypothetical protein